MVDGAPKYDVAISFLACDEPIAAALHTELSQTFNVFFYPHKQEDLAGTDGMESMRTPFLTDSRLMVVLYRERWGKTRWTAIEETAVKEACFNGEWKRLFFITLDRTSALPKWVPEYHVRYNLEDFGLQQAVGAIKARVLENGGQPSILTPTKRAELLRADELYRMDKSRLKSQEGLPQIQAELKYLFEHIGDQCEHVNQLGNLQIMHEAQSDRSCILTDGTVSMIVLWYQQYVNVLEDAHLCVQEFNSRLILPSEMGRLTYVLRPEQISEKKYDPDLSRARELGWKKRRASASFLSSATLAQKIVVQFIDLVDRYQRGVVKRPSF